MKIPLLDLKRQYKNIRNEIEPAVISCMENGIYIGGRQVADFENAIAEYLGVRHAIGVGNGTDALVVALRAANIGSGDEVITTPFTFFASAESIAAVGAVPVFADICEDTFNIDPKSIEQKITPKTRAILPVHIFGCPAQMDEINAIAKKHNLLVIEDACQAIGAEYKGKKTGGIADMGCFSFFPTKNLGCFGDGGLITTNDDSLAMLCRAFREHGGGKNGAAARNILENKAKAVEAPADADPQYNPFKYYNYLIGYNTRLDAIQAAVLNVKLKHLDGWNQKRCENAAYYKKNIKNSKVKVPVLEGSFKHIYHQFALLTEDKEGLIHHLSGKGIAAGVFYPVPLHLQKALDYLGYKKGDLPVAEKITSQTVCLPIYPELTREELEYITEAVNEY